MSKKDSFEVIHSYSRQEALADGVLIEATELAKEAGFKYPVALTSTVWGHCVTVPERCPWQDETGRLWDVLWMLLYEIKKTPNENPIYFTLYVQNSPTRTVPVTLKALCSPGDRGEPVITIMFPNED